MGRKNRLYQAGVGAGVPGYPRDGDTPCTLGLTSNGTTGGDTVETITRRYKICSTLFVFPHFIGVEEGLQSADRRKAFSLNART